MNDATDTPEPDAATQHIDEPMTLGDISDADFNYLVLLLRLTSETLKGLFPAGVFQITLEDEQITSAWDNREGVWDGIERASHGDI
jgi:hypothetical protein